MTFISEDKLWTIISGKHMHSCGSIAPRGGMKNKIESYTDYATIILHDPIKLLKAIKEHTLNYQEQQYKHTIVLDAMTSYSLQYQTTREQKSTRLHQMIPCSKRCIGISIWRTNCP
jgi:hypothetical protein